MTDTDRPMPITPATPLRVRFLDDPDSECALHDPEGNPLPGPRETYERSPIHRLINPDDDPATGARRPITYEEYCEYEGDPDRQVVLGAILEAQCATCRTWHHAASLWGIDFMDDAPELRTIAWGTFPTGSGGIEAYAIDDARITGYLREVVDELVAEARD